MIELDVWLSSVHIIPYVQYFLVKGLNLYLSNRPSNVFTQEYEYFTQIALHSQLRIRWDRTPDGFISQNIVDLQHYYLVDIESLKLGIYAQSSFKIIYGILHIIVRLIEIKHFMKKIP